MSLSADLEPVRLSSLFTPEGEGALLKACGTPEEPLEAVLDLLLGALGARYVICADFGPGRRVVGRRPPGRPIAWPERLVRSQLAGEFYRDPRPVLLDLSGSGGRSWAMGFPLLLGGEPTAAFFAEGPAPPPAEVAAQLALVSGRIAPWIALAWEVGELRRESRTLRRERCPSPDPPPGPAGEPTPALAEGNHDFPEIIARAPGMQEVLRTVALVAASDAAVLIEGESGTGKELIAQAIHRKSSRAGGPFVCENCAACPEGLLESEFFGVERGAFTGAQRTKPGLFERAHRGTLFLDEIGEMDLGLQRKLLRALQEKEVRRVGGSEAIPVDFRLISATNRVLEEEARAGRFRADLRYRIDVVAIRLPPLRERREDIPRLIDHFLTRHSENTRAARPPMDPAALRLLCDYAWPGNVRELENEMWRAVALRLHAITPTNLSAKIVSAGPRALGSPPRQLLTGRPLGEIEREILGGLIRDTLRRTGGNKIQAAQILGIPKTTLYRRLRRYAISEFSRRNTIN